MVNIHTDSTLYYCIFAKMREKKKRKVKQTICYAPAYFSDVHFLQKM